MDEGPLALFRSISRRSHRRCHSVVLRMMTGMVMHSAHRVMHLRHWLGGHWLGAGWSAWRCILRKGVTCETDCESGSCDKALNHRIVPVEEPLTVPTDKFRKASFVPTVTRSWAKLRA